MEGHHNEREMLSLQIEVLGNMLHQVGETRVRAAAEGRADRHHWDERWLISMLKFASAVYKGTQSAFGLGDK
jgi:hypothetical protein